MSDSTPSIRHGIRELRKIGALELAERLHDRLDRKPAGGLVLRREVAELVTALAGVTTRNDLLPCLEHVAEVFGCSHYSLFHVATTKAQGSRRLLETNYPLFWLIKYTLKGYASVDPILKIAREWHDSFYWDEADTSDQKVHNFFRDAQQSGIGPGGFTAVTLMGGSWHIAFSLSAAMETETFRDHFEAKREAFLIVAGAVSEAFFRVNFPRATAMSLNEKELAYMVHVWSGKQRDTFTGVAADARGALETAITRKMKCQTFDQAMMQIASSGLMETPEFLLQTLIADLPPDYEPKALPQGRIACRG